MPDDPLARQFLNDIKNKRSPFWERERENYSLALFHKAAREVPAYKDFLKKRRVNPAKIRTIADFQAVPPVSKKEYLRAYPLEKLVWSGTLANSMVFTATSGSTGKPFYFPRGEGLDWQSSVYHEMFLKTSGLSRDKSTLAIVGFGMGVWIGGLITYQAFKLAGSRGYPVTVLTAGTNKKEIFEAMRTIAPKFDQVILCGYPPFMKDIIDEGAEEGIRWKDFNIRILFAAEAFSEEFRDYMIKMVHAENPYRTTMNIYGSADLGTMAEETPLSILVRRVAVGNPDIFHGLFGGIEQLPTLAQFNPRFINFEAPEGNVLCTANNMLPLVRYEIGDRGGTMSYGQLASIFDSREVSLPWLIRDARLQDTVTELPFVYVYERSDFSIKLYGAIIYPEHIKTPLLRPEFRDALTGKFKMATRHTKKHEEYLEIAIELKRNAKASRALGRAVESAIVQALIEKNAEYHYLHGLMPKRVIPRLSFKTYGDPDYFRSGIKQKWVEK